MAVAPTPSGAGSGGQAFLAVALVSLASWQALFRVVFPSLCAQGALAVRAAGVLAVQAASGWQLWVWLHFLWQHLLVAFHRSGVWLAESARAQLS